MGQYKLISWNVNGIRATLKKGFWDIVKPLSADVLAIQETKADDSVMSQNILEHPEYEVYWHSHQQKKGYSGVCTLTKIPTKKFQTGFGVEEFDQEGRVVYTRFNEFTLLNIYFPNGGQGPHRVDYKLRFYDQCLEFIEEKRKQGEKMVICGDYNTAHQEIDLHDPDSNHKTTGFLPEERAWLDKLTQYGYIDTFRHFHPDERDVYTWWDLKTRSRSRNKGWRIDYFFVAEEVLPNLQDAFVLSEVEGSDHCPLGVILDF